MQRRQFLAGLAAAPLLGQARRPNTLFVLVDDLRYNCLSLLGHPWLKTPNIDRLGREGVTFTNAFVTTPLCSPSRASYLTGRWVHAHGIIDNTNRDEASHKLLTYPALQKKAGYETAFIGKWHMGNDSQPRPGFDHWVSFPGQGQYFDPQINRQGKLEKESGFMTDILNEAALEFLKRPRTKPFSLYLAHKAVHGPFTPPEKHKRLYEGAPVTRHPNANDDYSGKPAIAHGASAQAALARRAPAAPAAGAGQRGPSDETIRNQLRLLAAIDDGMGAIYDALRASGNLDNTLIVFTSDNGYFHGDHGLGDKRAAYEESLRIPMLARFPGWAKAGTTVTENVLNVDIAPTMLAAAGAKPHAQMKGLSLEPLLRGKKTKWREDFLAEYFFEKPFPHIPQWKAVRGKDWKLVQYDAKPEWTELYNLREDPYEMKNLAGESAAARQRAKLEGRLAGLLRETA
jgi:N-acetylglucosamine-6-sulfatase